MNVFSYNYDRKQIKSGILHIGVVRGTERSV